jgi:uncharacterized protein YutE (UPF0331/DUF86 family)
MRRGKALWKNSRRQKGLIRCERHCCQKVQSIQRCIKRAREESERAGSGFREDYTRQDAAILNITRACEQAIDLANHIIKTHKMGIPTSSRVKF